MCGSEKWALTVLKTFYVDWGQSAVLPWDLQNSFFTDICDLKEKTRINHKMSWKKL